MKKIWLIPFFCSLMVLARLEASEEGCSEEAILRRVQAHLLIGDTHVAVEELTQFMKDHSYSKNVEKEWILALTMDGREGDAVVRLKKFFTQFPEEQNDRAFLEKICWGILSHGIDSDSFIIRLMTLLGVYLTRDAKAVPFLKRLIQDENAFIRGIAVRFSADYADYCLQQGVGEMLEAEKDWSVRLEVLKAIGKMKLKEKESSLKEIASNDRLTFEERAIAIESLVHMYDVISFSQWQILAHSPKAGLRQLACEIASHLQIPEAQKEILALVKDPIPEVRMTALNALGLFYRPFVEETELRDLLKSVLKDPVSTVSITGSWVALLVDLSLGKEGFRKHFQGSLEEQRLVAAALAKGGKAGVDLSLKFLQKSSDLCVRVNLALGLIGQREQVSLACDVLYKALKEKREMWMVSGRINPLFSVLEPTQLKHRPEIPRYPETMDQITCLQLVSVLAIMEDFRAQDILKEFLKEKQWEVIGLTGTTLLKEGDQESLDILRTLLQDPDGHIRLQAAFVLAFLGKEDSVVPILQGAYFEADHSMKLQILEALGYLGSTSSFSFLIEVLQEPFQMLRILGASSLVQCTNR